MNNVDYSSVSHLSPATIAEQEEIINRILRRPKWLWYQELTGISQQSAETGSWLTYIAYLYLSWFGRIDRSTYATAILPLQIPVIIVLATFDKYMYSTPVTLLTLFICGFLAFPLVLKRCFDFESRELNANWINKLKPQYTRFLLLSSFFLVVPCSLFMLSGYLAKSKPVNLYGSVPANRLLKSNLNSK